MVVAAWFAAAIRRRLSRNSQTILIRAACLMAAAALTFAAGAGSASTRRPARPFESPWTYSTLHTFSTGGALATFSDSGPIGDGTGAFYGTIAYEYSNGPSGEIGCTNAEQLCGFIYKLAPTSNGYTTTVVHTFRRPGGIAFSPKLTIDRNGVLYGILFSQVSGRPVGDAATLYSLTPSAGGYIYRDHLFDFRGSRNEPAGDLVIDGWGALYGTSAHSADVYKLTPSASGYTRQVIYDAAVLGNGQFRRGYLCPPLAVDAAGAVSGAFQATRLLGGADGGFVFRLSPAGATYTSRTLLRFSGGGPSGPVFEDGAGSLYGFAGDIAAPNGYVYELTPVKGNYVAARPYSFSGIDEDGDPVGAPLVDGNGNIYGETGIGGNGTNGRLFALTPSAAGYTEVVVHNFASDQPTYPRHIIALAPDGSLVGSASHQYAGPPSYPEWATVFEVSP